MTLIQIYCIGAVTELLYMLVKRCTWSKQKAKECREGLKDFGFDNPVPIVCFFVFISSAIWPYVWFERLFLKRN